MARAGGFTRCSARDDARVRISPIRDPRITSAQARANAPVTQVWDALVVGGGPAGAATGLLAGAGRAPGARGREEALPPREDVRRRAHAAGGAPARGHGTRAPVVGFTPLRRTAVDRARRHARARVAVAPRLPRLRLRRAPSRPRPHGRRRVRGRGRRGVDRRRGRRPAGGGRSGRRRGGAATTVSRSRCGPATWWSPTAPTPGSAGRSAAPATAPTRWAWRCGATSPARSTTSPGSRATSTCATATATTCPGTAGSSRWATAP